MTDYIMRCHEDSDYQFSWYCKSQFLHGCKQCNWWGIIVHIVLHL